MSFVQAIAATFAVSMVPVIELKGGIPFGVGMGLSVGTATAAAVAGNIVVTVLVVSLLKPILNVLKDTRVGKKMSESFARKAKKITNASKFWGVLIFVAVPLPLTGVWTGSAIAVFLNMPYKKAILAVSLGAVICAAIVALLTLGVISL